MRNIPGPAEALAELLAGNRRFATARPRFGHDANSPAARTARHEPFALVLGCIDSRVPPEAVFDQDFGAVVVVRTGGHALDLAAIGSVEFAVSVFEVSLVLVLGHQYCGAVAASTRAVVDGNRPDGALGHLVNEIAPAVDEAAALAAGAGDDQLAELAVDRHVLRTVDRLAALPAARARVDAGALTIVGARYGVDTGEVTLLES